ncbi:NAD-dependent epimerase/dehydratase family protein [Ectothiorhodospiraceae bacterium 2226]|nr:NAD-dependent epimerase/dehydratase family protein [Ectothiorhodospiraceae bacterium 2226]
MATHVLITGGAGFIGSHLADDLLARGYRVRVLDNLSPQVHGADAHPPGYLNDDVELQIGDVRDPQAVRTALDGVDAVFHLAALVGVGQSMYQVADYLDVNTRGTGVLLEALIERPIERLVVASSMSIYGEGQYLDPQGDPVPGAERQLDQLRVGQWELSAPDGSGSLRPIPTPEEKPPALSSVYALSKYDQERLCLMVGQAYGIPTAALRLFNVFGTRQALSNPYTGVLAIFASRLQNGNPPLIFEDGRQQRDFVHVSDVVQALRLALESAQAPGRVFNVGSGQHYTVAEVAERLARVLGREDVVPEITGEFRTGDIRHCFADIARARDLLGYSPRKSFDEGLAELAQWVEGEVAVDRVAQARAELKARGLAL